MKTRFESLTMTMTIEAAVFSTAMKNAASIVQSTGILPICNNVRLVAKGGKLELTTSDLDIEYHQSLPCKGDIETTANASKLAQMAASVAGDSLLTLTVKDGRLSINAGRARWTLPTLAVADFPSLPVDKLCEPISVALPINRVSWAIYDGKAQPSLSGIFLHNEGGKVTLAATNNNSCGVASVDVKFPKDAPDVILAQKFCATLSSLSEGEVSLAWDERKVRAEFGEVTLTAKLIDGTFPQYRRIIPEPGVPVIVDPETLSAALKRVRLVADERTKGIKFDRSEDKVTISTASHDSSDGCEEVPAECSEAFASGVNGQFLASILAAIGGDSIEVHQEAPDKILMIRRVVNDGVMALAMPMRI